MPGGNIFKGKQFFRADCSPVDPCGPVGPGLLCQENRPFYRVHGAGAGHDSCGQGQTDQPVPRRRIRKKRKNGSTGGTASDLTSRSRKVSGKTHSTVALVSWIICTLYAGTDELHQYFVPGRACSLRDVCIDSAGALLGVLIMLYHSRKVL